MGICGVLFKDKPELLFLSLLRQAHALLLLGGWGVVGVPVKDHKSGYLGDVILE